MNNNSMNADWLHIDNPTKLATYAKAIAEGKFEFPVFVVGPGGTGKTEIFQKHLPLFNEFDDDHLRNKTKYAHWMEGTISPVEFYLAIARNKDRTLVADDCPDLYRNGTSRALLKQLCNTRSPRRVVYQKAVVPGSPLDLAAVPTETNTRSTFVLIANEWSNMGADIAAVNTRAKLIRYVPSLITRIKYAETWLGDTEIIRYVYESVRKGKVRRLHLRHLRHAQDFKRSGVEDWRLYLDRVFQPLDLDDIDDDAIWILRWVERTSDCGVFTKGQICRNVRFRGRQEHVDSLIRGLLDRGLIHELPKPKREGRYGKQPASMYSLGEALPEERPTPRITTSKTKR